MKTKHTIISGFTIICSFCLSITKSTAQEYNYSPPLDIPLELSANFGELRPNHFHSGVDFKTQRIVNKNVYSIEDGFVSRIGINAGGYGLVLYIDHPNGQTSVYAHLNKFAPKIAKFIKEKQYEQEKYTIDVGNIAPDLLPVKKGEFIALSGNTGSSGGPHVHFEIRDTESEHPIDPLPFYKNKIKDTTAPEIKGIAIYPIDNKGIVNRKVEPLRYVPTNDVKKTIEAWGQIGLGIYAIDKMDGTINSYGVKNVQLYCDGKEIFSTDINTLDFETTRMINSFTDFEYGKKNKRYYMKLFIEPGNKLQIYADSLTNGYIDINEEKTYNFKYILTDLYNNQTSYNLSIVGKSTEIPKTDSCSLVMLWDEANRYISDDFQLTIPKGYLYKNVNFVLDKKDSHFYSPSYQVHNKPVPLDKYVDMTIKLTSDTLENKNQYGVISIDDKGKINWVGGQYDDNGFVTAQIRELGNKYAIGSDTKKPTITPISPESWVKNKKIVVKLSDDLSGIKTLKGTIDGNFVLFQHDIKSPNYTYIFDDERLTKGGKHLFEFVATDGVGNASRYEYTFSY